MTRELKSADPLEFLRREQQLSDPPEGAEARVLSLLLSGQPSAILAAGVASAAGDSGAALSEAGGGTLLGLARRLFMQPLVPLAAGIAIGAGGHAVFDAQQGRAPASPSSVAAPAVVVAAPASGEVSAIPGVEPQVDAERDAQSRARLAPVAAPSARTDSLRAEQQILDRARKKLASGEPEQALEFLQQHAARHRHGKLSEEREAMLVNVLVTLGRNEEARSRGEAFRARFPGSLMQSAVDAALSTNAPPR